MGWRHGRWQKSSSSHYGALNFDLILPMRSRWYEEPILLTYGDENESQKVSGIGLVRVGFNYGEVFSRWCSSFKDVHQSFLEFPSSFLSSQLIQMVAESSNSLATKGLIVLYLQVKIQAMGGAIYKSFLDRVVDSKDSNLFLIHNRIYLTKICKRIKRGCFQLNLIRG
jgi:hypothetical protein